MKKSNTNKYDDYIIKDIFLVQTVIFKYQVIWELSAKGYFEHNTWQNTSDRYHFNIFIIIAIVYHIYVDYEL